MKVFSDIIMLQRCLKDRIITFNSIYMLVKVFNDIIMLQRCLNDIIMLWEQKCARLRGVPHTHRHCDSAYCRADLSHQHDVCRLKQTCTPKGAARKYLTTVTDVMILNYAVGLDVARVGPNPIPKACGLVNCLFTVFLYNYWPSRQNSCQAWVNSLAETFRVRSQGR